MPQSQSCFLLFLYFRKVTQEIFLELDETKAKLPIFSDTKTKFKAETEEGQGLATPWSGAGPSSRATRWCGPLVHPLASPFRLYILSKAKTLNRPVSVHKKFHSAATIEDQFWETEVSVLAPCRDGELPPKPFPSTPSHLHRHC
jgi:hypothetical protein